jgi:hypothetical protein
MLYDLVQKLKGKETVMMTDIRAKVDAQKRKYEISQRGKVNGNRVEYTVRESESDERKKRKSNGRATSGGDYRLDRPKRVGREGKAPDVHPARHY